MGFMHCIFSGGLGTLGTPVDVKPKPGPSYQSTRYLQRHFLNGIKGTFNRTVGQMSSLNVSLLSTTTVI